MTPPLVLLMVALAALLEPANLSWAELVLVMVAVPALLVS